MRISATAARRAAAVIGTSVAALMLGHGPAAQAAGVKVLSANGVRAILVDLTATFEKTTGHTVTIGFGEAGEIRKRIETGEAFDVSILPLPVLQEVAKQDRIVSATTVGLARTTFGMGVRAGQPRPDVSSVEGFKRSLLAARSIVITDPHSGGVTGVHFVGVLERLGVSDEITPRLKFNRGTYNAEFVARGEADLAVQGDHEIRCVPGIEFVPYPAEFQRSVIFAAALGSAATQAEAGTALIQFLSGPAAAPVLRAKCMERG
jgi:molybdate transport system substrate-binding protein